MSRGAFALPVVGIGLVAVLSGLVYLQWVFGEERNERLASIATHKKSAAELARREILEALELARQQADARLTATRRDPVRRPADLLHIDRGERRLPPRAPRPGNGRLQALLSATSTPPLDDDDERERWAHLLEVRAAVEAQDAPAAGGAFEKLLEHAVAHRLDPALEVASQLMALEALEALPPGPSDTLVQKVLLDGLVAPGGEDVGLPPLLGRISAERERLDERGLMLALSRLDTIGARHRVSLATLADDLAQQVPALPSTDAPVAAGGEIRSADDVTWLLWAPSWSEVRGVVIDPSAIATQTAASLASEALLPDDASLMPPTGALDSLALQVRSAAWERAVRLAERRYQQKTALALACALLAFVAMGLASWMVRRRQQLVELRTDFVATVSHELRTPLSAIRLLGETLERKLKDDPRARDYPAQIVRQVDRLGFLVDNLLSFNRVDKGRWDLRPETVDLHALAGEIKAEIESQMPGVRVDNAIAPGSELVADAELLHLLLGNLTRNGLTYTTATTPTVTLSMSGPRTLRVRDNGVGVADEDRERIFEPFARALAPRVSKKGTGLGLGLCRRIVGLHQGELVLADTSAEGSTFEVRLGALGTNAGE